MVLLNKTLDASLFHEMLHWFHFLRFPDRYERERTNAEYTLCGETLRGGGNYHSLGTFYWFALAGNDSREKESWFYWKGSDQIRRIFPSFEEIRTILGAPSVTLFSEVTGAPQSIFSSYKYFNGDELSENCYLAETGLPIRLSHEPAVFVEDWNVVDRALRVTNEALKAIGSSWISGRVKCAGFAKGQEVIRQALDQLITYGINNLLITNGEQELSREEAESVLLSKPAGNIANGLGFFIRW
jgi:hypothetical protein